MKVIRTYYTLMSTAATNQDNLQHQNCKRIAVKHGYELDAQCNCSTTNAQPLFLITLLHPEECAQIIYLNAFPSIYFYYPVRIAHDDA